EAILKLVSDGPWPENYINALEGVDLVELNSLFVNDYAEISQNVQTLVNFTQNQAENYCQAGSQRVLVNHIGELYESAQAVMSVPPHLLLFNITELIEKFALYKNICSTTNSNQNYISPSEAILKKSLEM